MEKIGAILQSLLVLPHTTDFAYFFFKPIYTLLCPKKKLSFTIYILILCTLYLLKWILVRVVFLIASNIMLDKL